MDSTTHPYLVPFDTAGSRKETAVLLVGTADEFKIDQRSIRMVRNGFRITQDLYDVLYDDADNAAEAEAAESEDKTEDAGDTEVKTEEPETKAKTTKKKTSGNRAAKTATDKE